MNYQRVEDAELVALAAQGREGAYRELLARYERPVFSLVYRMVRNRTVAEDLAQEAFIRTFNALDTYNPRYKFSSWIFKIANNLTIDHLRKRRVPTVSMHGAPDAVTAEAQARTRFVVKSTGESPEEYVQNRELGSRIEAAIGELREEYRVAVLLRHIEGHTYDEIAHIMDIPLGTVKTYLHRARAELQQRLAEV